jgi:hypothetical protein
MQPKPTFTGRPRRRKAHPWVKASDAFARFLITMGGIGTIAAVLMVGVFLVAVAMPLFGSARVGSGHWADVPHDPARLAAIGSDESGAVGWLLDGSGVTLFKTADGGRLAGKTASETGLAGASAIRVQPGTMQAVVGFENGSFRSGRIGIDSEFVAAADLDAVLRKLGPGEAAMDGDAVVVRGANDRHARLRFVADLAAEPERVLDSPVLDVDVTQLSDGPLAAALDQRGRVRVEAISSRRNLLTDEVVSTSSGATIEPESRRAGAGQATDAGGSRRPRFVRVSDLGDQVFVIDADGLSRRYEIRTIENPVLMEEFDVAPGEPDVAAVTRLFGGKSLAVADTKGTVRVFFATRAADATASDGLRMVAAKTFPPKRPGDAGAVTAIAASPRSRLFAVADAGGGIRLLQATGGTTVLELSNAAGAAGPSADMILITPRENRILAADPRRVAAWPFDAGYPEVSLDSLFGRLWYENYPRPVHAWETTGHESFESKFGLVPLVFGTLKATCFSMLFATPIALLAAIYSSQFMHPRWRARVKPTIEMMASLPSVVLGFIAGLILAPFVESRVMTVIAGCFTVPLTLLTGAHLWQLLPNRVAKRAGSGTVFRDLSGCPAARRDACEERRAADGAAAFSRRLSRLARRPRGQRTGRLDAGHAPPFGDRRGRALRQARQSLAAAGKRRLEPAPGRAHIAGNVRSRARTDRRVRRRGSRLSRRPAVRHPRWHLRHLRPAKCDDRRDRHEFRDHSADLHDRRRRALERAGTSAERLAGCGSHTLADGDSGNHSRGHERPVLGRDDRSRQGGRRDDDRADGRRQHAADWLEPVQWIPDAVGRHRHRTARSGPRYRPLQGFVPGRARPFCNHLRGQHGSGDRATAVPEKVL